MLNLYLDPAERSVAEPLLRSGCFTGLTTNPTLLHAAGIRRHDLGGMIDWARAAGAKAVFVQSWGTTQQELVSHGQKLCALGGEVVIKVPATAVGITAAAALEDLGTPVLVTAVCNAAQCLPAMAVGASYVAPYLGRMNDAGRNGIQEIARMQRSITAVGSGTRILVASLREPSDALTLAELGVRDFTFAPAAWSAFFTDPLTDEAVNVFEQASHAL